MNRHKQVLAIGRSIVGRGCNYSEANKLTRRIKYWGCVKNVDEKIAQLRTALDAAGLNDVQIRKATRWYNSEQFYAGINLYEPVTWFTEE